MFSTQRCEAWHAILIVFALMFSLFVPELARAQLVISSDTTWGEGQQINLQEDVIISSGVTLTIEPGVTVQANQRTFLVNGSLLLSGSADAKIQLLDTVLVFGQDEGLPGLIGFDHVEMLRGKFLPATGLARYGSFVLSNSRFSDVGGFYLWYPVGINVIERNVFERSSGLMVNLNSTGNLSIANNVFANQTSPYAVSVLANYDDTLSVERNSFLSIDRVALQVVPGAAATFRAVNNYFGTIDEVVINAMIIDRNDGLDRLSFIEFQPYLISSHPDTPTFILAEVPNPIQEPPNNPLIVLSDLTWGPDSVVTLNNDVHIAPGVTLSIESGVTVQANQRTFLVQGQLVMQGSASSPIRLIDGLLEFGQDSNVNGFIGMDGVEMQRGAFLPATGNAGYGYFMLRDSRFSDVEGFYLWYPAGVSSIERNVFDRSSGFRVLLNSEGSLSIINNVFARQASSGAISLLANYEDTLTVERNSFLSSDLVALEVVPGANGRFPAFDNYFGTVDQAIIDSMILDRSDGTDRLTFVEFQPYLLSPHPYTPRFSLGDSVMPACGSASGQAFYTQPTRNLCAVGDATVPVGSGPWFWNCNGDADAQAHCSAGRMEFQDANVIISVRSYYWTILNREVDSGGLAFWIAEAMRLHELSVGMEEAFRVMAGQFFNSAEYLGRNTSDVQFVTDLYRTFFRREPDQGGMDFWSGQFAQGIPRDIVMFNFLFSVEFGHYTESQFGATSSRPEVNLIVDFYRGLLGRLPDSDGFHYWLSRFRSAQCSGPDAVTAEVDAISRLFANLPEYGARGRNNAQYVADLYYAFLRRGGDLGGFNAWGNALETGSVSREDVRWQFMLSPEFQGRVGQAVSAGCLA